MDPVPAVSMSSASVVVGSPVPRLWTPPLRELTPETSFGYDLIDFAERIGYPFDPWQRWLAIHMGELLSDGRPRFRMVLVLVARQNGKTLFCRVLTLYWLHIEERALVIGTHTNGDKARASWEAVCDMAKNDPDLWQEYDPGRGKGIKLTVNVAALTTRAGASYRFAAPNRRAGRGDTVHAAILDEIREHRTFDTYNAVVHAMRAVPDAQCVAITNQGDVEAVVLDSLRESGLDYIETGQGDSRLFLAEWSAPNGSDVLDPAAIAAANPNLGIRFDLDSLMGDAIRAKRAGGAELAGFKTEALCMRVHLLDPAIDEDAWEAAGRTAPLDLAEHRKRVALCLDVALNGEHATLVAAATIDDVTHIEVVKVWQGFGATTALRRELPGIVEKIKPRAVGWFPNGPAAAVAADLKDRRGNRTWPPRGVKIIELTAEAAPVCMGFADLIAAGQVAHAGDPMLTAHVHATQKLNRGDAQWVYTRRGVAPIDGTYAAAGATHLARTMPAPLPDLIVST